MGIKEEIFARLKTQPRPKKRFAAILFGENAISENFLKQKENAAKELGIDFKIYKFSDAAVKGMTNDGARKEVLKIALQKPVGGMIVQLPLPEHLNRQERFTRAVIRCCRRLSALCKKFYLLLATRYSLKKWLLSV
ncbi:MAG: hypothetical protein HYW34_01880 [Candidatus Brennerbacteria bacterium]|nr:hypothetical protein [Candidatus Brennerbacteria bacterium]